MKNYQKRPERIAYQSFLNQRVCILKVLLWKQRLEHQASGINCFKIIDVPQIFWQRQLPAAYHPRKPSPVSPGLQLPSCASASVLHASLHELSEPCNDQDLLEHLASVELALKQVSVWILVDGKGTQVTAAYAGATLHYSKSCSIEGVLSARRRDLQILTSGIADSQAFTLYKCSK